MKHYRILGKKGRITIPHEIRIRCGFAYNDLVSFAENGDSIVIRREKICDACRKEKAELPLTDFLDSLSSKEQHTALVHLSLLWSQREREVADEQ